MEAAGSISSSGGRGLVVGTAITSSPEKTVNRFVRAVALIEKLGNALGTLVFTWATVVLLGGYPTVLGQGQDGDFCYAVLIVSLEALRMFNRENTMDYQLFFRSRGSVRHLGWNGLIVVAWLSNVMVMLSYLLPAPAASAASAIRLRKLLQVLGLLLLLLTAVISKFLSPGALRLLPVTVRRFISLTSPLAAVLLLVPSLVKATSAKQSHIHMVANWVMFTLLLIAVLVLTVSRLHFPSIIKLLDAGLGLGSKHVFWRRLILNVCMFAELIMLVFIHDSINHRIVMSLFQVYALSSVLFGNLLMPTAVMRVVLALSRLVPHDYNNGSAQDQLESRVNLEPSLDIFYTMVLCQGILHIVSCNLEMLSFIPRSSLAREVGFTGHRGSQSANLYYEYAREKCMEVHIVARKQISLHSFVIQAISSDSPKLQFHGVWIMHSLLRKEPSRTRLLSKLHKDANATARLIDMLEWRSPEDATIRLFAAKVTASAMLAGTLRIISVPGAMQAFSALLDVDSDATETESGGPEDSLPALALSIFDSLANKDSYYFHSNCLKISKEADALIPKIMQFFICYKDNGNGTQEQSINETATAAVQRRFFMCSALQLLGKLSSIGGKIGTRLRHELMEHPTLQRNVAAILDDRFSSQEARKLAIVVLRNLAM